MRIAVCMAVYKKDELTHSVLAQIEEEADLVDVFICDNSGDFVPRSSRAIVLAQRQNLGWLRGSNLAWRAAIDAKVDYQAFVLLNNDVVLSKGFFTNLMEAVQVFGGDIVGPLYDDVCRFQYAGELDAPSFQPRRTFTNAAFVDGTCMLVTKSVVAELGLLDENSFGRFGWGADMDYCFRARSKGFRVGVSHSAFLNHIGCVTANAMTPDYKKQALWEYRRSMTKKYGRFWGRHLELGLIRRVVKALRCFLTSIKPVLSRPPL